jgi:hypothetical protein
MIEAAPPEIMNIEALDKAIGEKIGDSVKAEDLANELNSNVFPIVPDDLKSGVCFKRQLISCKSKLG